MPSEDHELPLRIASISEWVYSCLLLRKEGWSPSYLTNVCVPSREYLSLSADVCITWSKSTLSTSEESIITNVLLFIINKVLLWCYLIQGFLVLFRYYFRLYRCNYSQNDKGVEVYLLCKPLNCKYYLLH